MSIWQRLKNLWSLSAMDISAKSPKDKVKFDLAKMKSIFTGDKQAQIVDLKDPLDIELE